MKHLVAVTILAILVVAPRGRVFANERPEFPPVDSAAAITRPQFNIHYPQISLSLHTTFFLPEYRRLEGSFEGIFDVAGATQSPRGLPNPGVSPGLLVRLHLSHRVSFWWEVALGESPSHTAASYRSLSLSAMFTLTPPDFRIFSLSAGIGVGAEKLWVRQDYSLHLPDSRILDLITWETRQRTVIPLTAALELPSARTSHVSLLLAAGRVIGPIDRGEVTVYDNGSTSVVPMEAEMSGWRLTLGITTWF